MSWTAKLLVGGVYFGYAVGLILVHATLALDNPNVAPLTGSLAGIALVVPLVPLKRYGFLSG